MTDERSVPGIADFLSRSFRLDLRSLAAFRVGLGVLVILDLLNRGLWLSAHYTDWGVMPRDALLGNLWDRAWMSIHLFSGTFWPTLILFVISGIFALLLVIGYRTTLVTAVSWFLMISLHARNPMVLQGGDIVFRLLLFWAMFLPIGARWSVDAALDASEEGQPTEPDTAPVKCSRLVFSLLLAMGVGLLSVVVPNPGFDLGYPVIDGGLAWESYTFTIRQLMVGGAIVFALASAVWIYFLDDGERETQEPSVETGDNAHFSAAAVAFVAQMTFIYFFAAILKTGDEWWPDLTATYLALSLDQFTTPLGDWLQTLGGETTPFLKAFTAGALGLEAFGCLLLFTVVVLPVFFLDPIHRAVLAAFVVPTSFYLESHPLLVAGFAAYFFLPVLVMKWSRSILDFAHRSAPFFRMVAVISFIGMHVGFAVTMRLGLFSYIVSVGWLALLPSWFWEQLADRVESFGESTTIRVAQPGGLVEKGARIARTAFLLPAAQVEMGAEDEEDEGEEIPRFAVEVDDDEMTGFTALAALAKQSVFGRPVWWVADRLSFPKAAFRRVVRAFDERASWRRVVDRALPLSSYRVAQTAVGSFLAVMALCGAFWWNMQTLKSEFAMVQPWRTLTVYVRLDQQWNMFAPYPLKEDGWYVIPGNLRNGEKVSLFQKPHREPPEWEKPDDVSATYDNQRWRKYMMNIWLAKYSDERLYYGRYLCRKWNSNHDRDEHLMTFKIYFMKEMSTEPGKPDAEPEKTHLWSHHCFADPDDEDDESDEDSDEESEESKSDDEKDGDSDEIADELPMPSELEDGKKQKEMPTPSELEKADKENKQ